MAYRNVQHVARTVPEPNRLPFELRLLEQKGHKVAIKDAMGSTQSIMLTERGLYGASDPRTPAALTLGY
jgi:gamma-glutamyltranspeptidase